MDQQWPLPQKQAGTTPAAPVHHRKCALPAAALPDPANRPPARPLRQTGSNPGWQARHHRAGSPHGTCPRGPTPPPAPARPPSATRRDCRAVAPRDDDCNDAGAGSWNRPPATRDAAPRAVRTLQAPATGRAGRGEQSTRTSQLHHPEISVVRLKTGLLSVNQWRIVRTSVLDGPDGSIKNGASVAAEPSR